MATMPVQKPGKSEQVVCTPKILLDAVKNRPFIDEFGSDLAADKSNSVGLFYYDEAANALEQPWPLSGWNWCNPPYSHIEPWVIKACQETQRGAHTIMLLPASVGSN